MRNPPSAADRPTPPGPPVYTILVAVCAAAALLVESVAVYFRAFTGFSWFDDEGYVLLGIRALRHGSRLYDQIYTQYGPFYFLLQSAIYSAFHAEVTHSAGRLVMIGFWLLTGLLCAWSVFRLTHSLLLTAAGFIATIKLLFFFTGSPGHPEELCVALVAAIAVTVCYCGGRHNRAAMVLFGALLAALTLTKINIGCYASIALALALCCASPPGRWRTVVYVLLSAATITLPFVVMKPLLASGWAQRVSLLVVLATSTSIVVAWRSCTPLFMTPRLWAAGTAAFLACSALIAGGFLLAGTSISAMLEMTVLQHRGVAKNWYISFPVYTELIPLLALALAVAWIRLGAASTQQARTMLAWNALKGAIGAMSLLATLGTFELGWKIPSTIIYNIAIPFCWLVLVPSGGGIEEEDSKRFARTSLCLLGALVALYPLPVGGAQVSLSVVLTILTSCVYLDDARRTFAAAGILTAQRMRIIEMAVAVPLAAVYLFDLTQSMRRYDLESPLALPGATRIRLDSAQAADYEWITGYLNRSCDSNFSMPEISSLYLWTKSESPTMWNVSDWYGLLDESRQQIVVQDLSRYPKMCVVYNPDLVEFWRRGQDLSRSPLARYIQAEFTAAASHGRYVVLVRKPPVR